MIPENIIALDALESEKHIVLDLTGAIVETSNQNLKDTFKQMRNQAEQTHHEIYQIAEQNGWYMAAGNADGQQINKFNNFFNQTFLNENNQQRQQTHSPGYNQQGQKQYGYSPQQNQQSTPHSTYQGGQYQNMQNSAYKDQRPDNSE